MPAAPRRTRNETRNGQDMAVRAAWLYYVEGLTQEAIAAAMDLSRAKVIRLLAAAREQGVVRTHIDAKGSGQLALERELVAAFGLDEAVVAPAPAADAAVAAVVGHAAGSYLAAQVRDGMSLGVADPEAIENSLVTEREPVSSFATFLS